MLYLCTTSINYITLSYILYFLNIALDLLRKLSNTDVSLTSIFLIYPSSDNLPLSVLEDSFCHKDYRGRGLHSKYNLFRLKKILEYGRIYAFVFVFSENIYAINTQKKSGLKEFFNFKVGKIFGFPFSTFRQNFNSNTFFNK